MSITSQPDGVLPRSIEPSGDVCQGDGRGDRAHEPHRGTHPGVSGIGVPSWFPAPPPGCSFSFARTKWNAESAKSLDKMAPRHRMDKPVAGCCYARTLRGCYCERGFRFCADFALVPRFPARW